MEKTLLENAGATQDKNYGNWVNNGESIFKDGQIKEEEKGFLEEFIEAIELVDDSEDAGDSIIYYDEYGTTLFCVDIVGDNTYVFRFYDNSYTISEETMQKIKKVFADKITA